jgi:hypothetical protein
VFYSVLLEFLWYLLNHLIVLLGLLKRNLVCMNHIVLFVVVVVIVLALVLHRQALAQVQLSYNLVQAYQGLYFLPD